MRLFLLATFAAAVLAGACGSVTPAPVGDDAASPMPPDAGPDAGVDAPDGGDPPPPPPPPTTMSIVGGGQPLAGGPYRLDATLGPTTDHAALGGGAYTLTPMTPVQP